LSLTDGVAKVTTADTVAGGTVVEIFDGHVMLGTVLSFTITLKLQEFVLPAESVTVLTTMLVPG